MRIVAEKTVDASGALSSTVGGLGIVNTNTDRGFGLWESRSAYFEVAESSGTLLCWESRGGCYILVDLLTLNTTVEELDARCTDLRNGLSLSGNILDQQQKTIVSGSAWPSSVAKISQENLQCQIAATRVEGLDKKSSDQRTGPLLMGSLMTVAFAFLGYLATWLVR